MRSKAALVIVGCLCGSAFLSGQRGRGTQPALAETVAPEIPGVVAAGTKVELVKEGVQGAQGAIAAPDGSLLFTERTASKITKLDKDGNFSTYLENTSATNSFTIDASGRVIAVQFAPPQVAVLAPTPRVLADKFEGQPFGRPNDLVVDKKGGVYFTDDMAVPPNKNAVFYVSAPGQIIKITDNIARPNGVQLSPDEKVLYVANTNGEHVIAFEVQPDGSTRNQREFGRLEGVSRTDTGVSSGADGIAVDAAGRLFVTSTIGVQVFGPQGRHLGTIPMPRAVQNLAFAGPDRKTLYVMGGGSLYKIQMQTKGYTGRPK